MLFENKLSLGIGYWALDIVIQVNKAFFPVFQYPTVRNGSSQWQFAMASVSHLMVEAESFATASATSRRLRAGKQPDNEVESVALSRGGRPILFEYKEGDWGDLIQSRASFESRL
jgi:hypothetical protein